MTDLASELAILEDHYAQVESGLADRKAAQQAELQTMADAFNAENVAAARELVLTEGAMRHIKGKMRRNDQKIEDEVDVAEVRRILNDPLEERIALKDIAAELAEHTSAQQSDVSLLNRIHRKQNADAHERQATTAQSAAPLLKSWGALSVPDNDPD